MVLVVRSFEDGKGVDGSWTGGGFGREVKGEGEGASVIKKYGSENMSHGERESMKSKAVRTSIIYTSQAQ